MILKLWWDVWLITTSLNIVRASLEPSTYRRLKDTLTEEFERLRKYFTVLDMTVEELKVRIITLPYVKLIYDMLCYTMLSHAMIWYVMLSNVILRHAMLLLLLLLLFLRRLPICKYYSQIHQFTSICAPIHTLYFLLQPILYFSSLRFTSFLTSIDTLIHTPTHTPILFPSYSNSIFLFHASEFCGVFAQWVQSRRNQHSLDHCYG